jgi:apolipoprotein N-acyltransferase
VLLGTSYIPFPPWAIFFCYVPLWFVWLHSRSWKQVVLTGWVAQFVGTLIGFNWVAYTVHEFGQMPWPVAILTLIGFAAIANIYMAVAGLAWHLYVTKLRLSRTGAVWALPVMMSIAERLSPMIFDWHFGYTWLWAGFPALQFADVIGFMGLSTLGNFFNAVLLRALLHARDGRRWWTWAAAVPALFAAMNLAGYLYGPKPARTQACGFSWSRPTSATTKNLRAEQGNARDAVVENFRRVTAEGLRGPQKPDFVVWPETAFPEILDDPAMRAGYAAELREIVTGVRDEAQYRRLFGRPRQPQGRERVPGSRQLGPLARAALPQDPAPRLRRVPPGRRLLPGPLRCPAAGLGTLPEAPAPQSSMRPASGSGRRSVTRACSTGSRGASPTTARRSSST